MRTKKISVKISHAINAGNKHAIIVKEIQCKIYSPANFKESFEIQSFL